MTALFLQGNSRDVLKNLPADYFHCATTSPPYFGLRRYQGGEEVWDGDLNCQHEWIDSSTPRTGGVGDYEVGRVGNARARTGSHEGKKSDTCAKCNAWKGQLGAEHTPELYIQHLIQIMREVRRVLRPDGVFWLNIGDSWASSPKGNKVPSGLQSKNYGIGSDAPMKRNIKWSETGCRPLDMVLIPEQLALAARVDGWYVRSILIWAKGVSLSDEYNGNPMPECLDPSTKVFIRTQDGWMHRVSLAGLSSMNPLPQILSPTGWVGIKNIWKTDKPAMTLQAGKVERVICSPDHRFPVSHDRRRVSTELKEASGIRFVGYNDYLLYRPIQDFCSVKIETYGRYSLNYAVGYLVGIYVAEGNTDTRFGNGIQISLGDHETELHDRVAGLFRKYDISVYDDGHSGRRNVFRVYDESFCRLIDAFVTGYAKTKRLSIDLILNSPEQFRQGLLDGYIAGDGSGRPAGGWCAASASRRLRDDISTLASSLGVITSKGQQRGISEIAPKLSVGHTIWTPYIERGEKNGTDGVFCIPVRRREGTRQKGKTKPMIDIEVDGGLFLIGDGLVSHNSVNGWRWERHRVSRCPQCGAYSSFRRRVCKECGWKKPANRGETEAWRAETGQQEHDSDGSFASDSFFIDCPGCPKCEKNGGYVLRKGSWRPTDSYEHILMLTKTNHYFCDRDAVLKPVAQSTIGRGKVSFGGEKGRNYNPEKNDPNFRNGSEQWGREYDYQKSNGNGGRNLRSVLAVPTSPFKGSHFAVYPPRLIEPLLKSATSEKGCCPKCGAPYARVIDKGFTAHDGDTATEYAEGTNANRLALLRQAARQRGTEYGRLSYNSKYKEGGVTGLATQGFQRNETIEDERSRSRVDAERLFPNNERAQQDYINYIHDHGGLDKGRTIGWLPTCECGIQETEPCRVLDPFSGAGTTALVCERLGLDSVNIDTSVEYIRLAEARIVEDEQKRIDEQIKRLKRGAKLEAKLSSRSG